MAKRAPLCLGQFLATVSPLKFMKNAFYFILKAQDIENFALTFRSC